MPLQQKSQTLTHLAQILGLDVQLASISQADIDVGWIESLLRQRQQARQEKRHAESVSEGISFAARIRNELQSAGITITDHRMDILAGISK